jgi:hypothetical protein
MSTTPTERPLSCACCGSNFGESDVVRLQHRSDTVLCLVCVRWLAGHSSRAIPVLATGDVPGSVAFWQAAGFDVEMHSDDFAIAQNFGIELHIVLATAEVRAGGGCYLHLEGVDEVHDAWRGAGLSVSDVRDEPWDMREFNVVDPGGNRVRIGQNI